MSKYHEVSVYFKNSLKDFYYNSAGEEMPGTDFNTQLTKSEAFKVFNLLKKESKNWIDFEIEIRKISIDRFENFHIESVAYFSDYSKFSKTMEC